MTSQNPFGSKVGTRLTFGGGMGFIALFALLPAGAVAVLSLTDIQAAPNIPIHWVGLFNYRIFFSSAQLAYNVTALEHTLEFAFSTTIIINVIALLVAVALNQRVFGRILLRAVVFIPTLLGVTLIGLIWSLFFNPDGGPAAALWSLFGSSSAFLGSRHLAFPIVIFVQIWAGVGFSMVIYLAGLQAISPEFYEVASIDGASSWGKLRFVTIPMLAPAVTANVLLAIIGALQSYQLDYVLTGTSNPATSLLSLEIFGQAFGNASGSGGDISQGYASAISIVQFVVVGIIALTVLAYLRRRETQL